MPRFEALLGDCSRFGIRLSYAEQPSPDGFAWNDPAIGIEWPDVVGTCSGTASAEGYCLTDGTPLRLSEKDQKWPSIEK